MEPELTQLTNTVESQSKPIAFVMPDNLRMNAYYYSFDLTGVREIDEILSAVAMAGKGYHHTSMWNEKIDFYGFSYEDLIQEMANRAAKKLKGN